MAMWVTARRVPSLYQHFARSFHATSVNLQQSFKDGNFLGCNFNLDLLNNPHPHMYS